MAIAIGHRQMHCVLNPFEHGVCAGCTFTDFDGNHVAYTQMGGTLSLVDCNFEGNNLFPSDYGAAVIQANAAAVRMEGCTFNDNSPTSVPILLADNSDSATANGVFYSDSTSPSVCMYVAAYKGAQTPPPCEHSSPKTLIEARSGFLTGSDAWLLDMQQVWHPLIL